MLQGNNVKVGADFHERKLTDKLNRGKNTGKLLRLVPTKQGNYTTVSKRKVTSIERARRQYQRREKKKPNCASRSNYIEQFLFFIAD